MTQRLSRRQKRKKLWAEFKRRREATQIFAEILEICRKPTARYKIMRGAHLSYAKALRLLEHLIKTELLKGTSPRKGTR